ncbi:autotransporter outer membrane beta-barrel domain-containing protein [bacterium]|nr:autotransporter outer membrane beta-barrel domain-containing protein [bacterium]
MNRILLLAFGSALLTANSYAQKKETLHKKTQEKQEVFESELKFKAYGVANYYAFDWETLPDKRNSLDAERLNLYLYYDFSEKIQFKSEVEFEHGGTGVTMDFDPLEEFGEFEQEIEKGGEVVLEQVNLFFKIKPQLNVRIGKLKLCTGNAAKLDHPKEYFTAFRSEVENTILPLGWYETGIEFSGDFHTQHHFPFLSYKAYVVSGLDNTGFSSQNWIKRGYQTHFETINANNPAYALRLDWIFEKDSEIGFDFYACNATGNRPKKDFTLPSWVTFGSVHFFWEKHPFRARSYAMLGNIQNSDELSKANRNLSNNLNVKRTPVGKMAAGFYTELAYDLLHIIKPDASQEFYLFGRTEWYDSMLKTEGTVSDNPRYERKVQTFGFNYFPHPNVVLKTHFSHRTLGSEEVENTFVLGFGFDF